jgi:hypothetical protein
MREIQMRRFIINSAIVILFALLFAGCTKHTMEPQPADKEKAIQNQESTTSLDEIIRLQQEIIKLRQRIFDDTKIKLENAQASLSDLSEARAKLADAKIQLAQFQERNDQVIIELQNLIQFYTSIRGQYLDILESGKGKAKELYEFEIALMETNIRLSQAILEMAPSGVNRL